MVVYMRKQSRMKLITIDRFIDDTLFCGMAYVGRYMLYHGTRPMKEFVNDYEAASKLIEFGAPPALITAQLAKQRIPGGWDFNKLRLAEFAEARPIPKITIGLLDQSLSYLDELPLRPTTWPGIAGLAKVGLNPEAYSGFFGSRDFHGKKRVAQIYSISVVHACYERIAHGALPTSLFEIGGRDKIADELTDPSRLILMDDLVPTIIGTMICRPILNMFMASKTSPIYMGSSWSKTGFERFLHDIDHETTVENDWSHFDTTVPEIAIRYAFGILQSLYIARSPEQHNEISNVMRYLYVNFTFSLMVTPGGYVYRKSRGIPSGSPLTSLVGSLVNWLIHRAIFSAVFPPGRGVGCAGHPRLTIAGDDSTSSQPESMVAGVTHAYLLAERLFGVLVKGGVPRTTRRAERFMWEHAPTFLGYTFRNQYPERTDAEIIEKIIAHEFYKGREIGVLHRWERAATAIQLSPFTADERPWLIEYFRWCAKEAGLGGAEEQLLANKLEEAYDVVLNPKSVLSLWVPVKDQIRKGRPKWGPPELYLPHTPTLVKVSHYVTTDYDPGPPFNTWRFLASLKLSYV
jgi:hypothetical protein